MTISTVDRHAVIVAFDDVDQCENLCNAMDRQGRDYCIAADRSFDGPETVDESSAVMVYRNCYEYPDDFFRYIRTIAARWYGKESILEFQPMAGTRRDAFLIAWRAGHYPANDARVVATGRLARLLQRGIPVNVPRKLVFNDGTEWAVNLSLMERECAA